MRFAAIAVSAVSHCSPPAGRGCARRSAIVVLAIPALLRRSVETIAEIAQSWHDVFVVVEPLVDDGCVDVNVRMMTLDERDALRRRDDADDADGGGAGPRQEIERRDG